MEIETRMLESIDKIVHFSELTREQIVSTPKMLHVADLVSRVGMERLQYVVSQRMGSHHTHGTFTSLFTNYVTVSEHSNSDPQIYERISKVEHFQLLGPCFNVIPAAQVYVHSVLGANGVKLAADSSEKLECAMDALSTYFDLVSQGDFEPTNSPGT